MIKLDLDHNADISYTDRYGQQKYLYSHYYVKSANLKQGVRVVIPLYNIEVSSCRLVGKEKMNDSFAVLITSSCSLSGLVVQAQKMGADFVFFKPEGDFNIDYLKKNKY